MRPPPLPDPAAFARWGPDVIQQVQDGIVVCDKPSGLPTTGRDLADLNCLQALVMARLRRTRIWAIHQLDADTSGLVLMASRKAQVEEWGAHLRRGEKRYLAVVRGRWEGGPRTIEAAIGERIEGHARFPAVRKEGKPARSQVRPLGIGPAASLVEVRIETGRTHQVRLHLAHVGHPILGERLHVHPPCDRAPRQALHAWRIDLPGTPLPRLEAPLPADLRALLDAEGIHWEKAPTELT